MCVARHASYGRFAIPAAIGGVNFSCLGSSMRWIVVMLLLCNVIYFAVQQLRPNDNALVAEYVDAGSPRLVIVAERDKNQAPEGSTINVDSEDEPTVPDSVVAIDDEQRPIKQDISVEPVIEESQCWLVGPARDEVFMKQIVSRFAAADIAISPIVISVEKEPLFWVYIESLTSRREALRYLRDLHSKNIDSFVVTEGEYTNGISLGFFSGKQRAERLQSKLREQGLPVQTLVRKRFDQQTWFSLDELASSNFDQVAWDEIRDGSESLQRNKKSCSSIASLKNIE